MCSATASEMAMILSDRFTTIHIKVYRTVSDWETISRTCQTCGTPASFAASAPLSTELVFE